MSKIAVVDIVGKSNSLQLMKLKIKILSTEGLGMCLGLTVSYECAWCAFLSEDYRAFCFL